MTSRLKRHLVVVVEDDETVRSLICALLEADGFRTRACGDGIEGLRTVRELGPSVVTLDLFMPRMDGLEVLDRLAADESTATLPVVIVSACASDLPLRSHPQVKAVIRKPFGAQELCETVRRAARAA